MILNLAKWTFDGSESYKIVDIKPCCDTITHTNIIDLRNGWFNNSEFYYEAEIGIALHEENAYIDEDDYLNTNDKYYKINHCPFCGAEIHIKIVSEIDKTEEYKTLEKEVNALREKTRKCDSKKKSYELENEVRKLDNELNNFYCNVFLE